MKSYKDPSFQGCRAEGSQVRFNRDKPLAVVGSVFMSLDDEIIETPEGPMTWAQWKKKHPIQIPSRRTKGKDLPVKVKRFTSDR